MQAAASRLKTVRDALLRLNFSGLAPVVGLLIPVGGIYAGQVLVRAIPKATYWGMAVVALSLALLILRLHPRAAKFPTNWLQIGLGFLIVAPLVLNVENWKNWTPPWELIGVWAVGCFFVMAAVSRFKPQPIELGLKAFRGFDRRDWLIVILLLCGALLWRVPGIETIPLGVDPDEGSLALSAVDAATGVATDPFATGWVTHPTLQFFINGLFIRWFGRTFLAMRLPWAIVGSLMVPMLYLLARIGYSRRVAALAGLLALGSNVAIHFSRLGLNNVGDSLFVTLVLAALWYAGATGSPKAYAIAGGSLGFAQYFYFGTRAIPFVVLAALIVWTIADRRGVWRARRLLLGALLSFLVVGCPLFGHWLRSPGSISEHLFLTIPFSQHMQEQAARAGVSVWLLWWRSLRDSLLVFTSVADRGSFYHPGQPMLHPLQAPLFIIGLVAIFAKWRRPVNQALLAWILVVLTLGSILITDPATFHRILGVLPAAILVVAIGIDAGVDTLARFGRWSPRTATRLAAVIVAVLVLVDVHYYFWIYNVKQAYKTPTQEAVSIAALEYERMDGAGTFILCTREGVDTEIGTIYHTPIAYVAGADFLGWSTRVEAELHSDLPLYFYLLPDCFDQLPRLMQEYPGGTLTEYHRSSDDLLIMMRYAVTSPQ